MRIFLTAALLFAMSSVVEYSTAAESSASLTSALESILEPNLRRHIEVLASDSFEGREAGARGGRAAATYLQQALRQAGLRPAGNAGTYFQEFGPGYRNVLARLPGAGTLEQEYILLTSHYDHVGYGSVQNSLGPVGYIHNGADDNASGVSLLLEVAEALRRTTPARSRTVLLIFWDAEEKGLLGSKHWLRQPTIDLAKIHLLVNVDMVGRMRSAEGVSLYGARSAPGFRELWSRANGSTELKLQFPWETLDNSDHFPFLQRGIPAVMVHTGLHEDYHRPSDDAYKINASGIREIGKLVVQSIQELRQEEARRSFRSACISETKAEQARHEQDNSTRPIRLGVTWDNLSDEAPDGVRIRQVWKGSAAERAGLRPGDSITHLSGRQLTSVRELRRAVVLSRGPLELRVARAAESLTVNVVLDGAPVRVGIAWRMDEAEPAAVMISHLVPGSPADEAGLHRLDRILEINGRRFAAAEFREQLQSAWGVTDLLIERDGRLRSVQLSLPAI